MIPRRLAWGLAAVTLYLVSAQVSLWMGLVPARPLLDGLAPPPRYRWVQPPPELEEGNIRPEAGAGTLSLGSSGTEQASIATPDAQAVVILPLNAIAPAPDQTEVGLEITPVDPAKLPPPPAGLAIEGNAYRIQAAYRPSGQPAAPAQPVGVVLRYPIDATALLLLAGEDWREIPANLASGTLSILAETEALGTFAPARPQRSRRSSAPSPSPWAYLAAGSALAAAVALSLDGRRRKPQHR